MTSNRRTILLAVLAEANGGRFTPTQLQKALFLISRNIPDAFEARATYTFTPYNYGPFDAAIYRDAEALASEAKVDIALASAGRWKEYAASQAGVREGKAVLEQLSPNHKEYIQRVTVWVRSLSFQQLVKAIYDSYPEMRANSIFQG
jgi:uncharacterized protein